jgi:hypothetical protein
VIRVSTTSSSELEPPGRCWPTDSPTIRITRFCCCSVRRARVESLDLRPEGRNNYEYMTPPVASSGRVELRTGGRVLGGSSVVDGMMWVRHATADWDGVSARGYTAFSWDRVLTACRALDEVCSLRAMDLQPNGLEPGNSFRRLLRQTKRIRLRSLKLEAIWISPS